MSSSSAKSGRGRPTDNDTTNQPGALHSIDRAVETHRPGADGGGSKGVRKMKRLLLLSSLTLALVLNGLVARPIGSARVELPASLTDQEFWRLTEEMSEPNGAFTSDNLLSNERVFARLVPELVAKTKPGGVYLGVGPEQNFTYIAAMRPRMAFITDIRRGNLHLQLMYKALFELSADRAEFVSRLFTKPRPAGLTATSSVTELMNAYWEAFTSDEVLTRVGKRHGKTAGQVSLRWLIQKGAIVIPRTSKVERLTENMTVFDFELSAADMAEVDALAKPAGRVVSVGWAPRWD